MALFFSVPIRVNENLQFKIKCKYLIKIFKFQFEVIRVQIELISRIGIDSIFLTNNYLNLIKKTNYIN
jgi:hypothetical protein